MHANMRCLPSTNTAILQTHSALATAKIKILMRLYLLSFLFFSIIC